MGEVRSLSVLYVGDAFDSASMDGDFGMGTHQGIDVAVLLATYNGSKYVEQQIKSLAENNTPFTIHWLDDHSTDDTRGVLQASARSAGVPLRVWHQPQALITGCT